MYSNLHVKFANKVNFYDHLAICDNDDDDELEWMNQFEVCICPLSSVISNVLYLQKIKNLIPISHLSIYVSVPNL